MSFLARLAARAAPARRAIAPKGFVRRAPATEPPAEDDQEMQPLHRQHDEEEAAHPVRRAAPSPRSLRRALEKEDEPEPPAQPLRRAGAGDAPQPDEDDRARPLRRAPDDEEEEEAQALRRAGGQPEEEEAKPLRRAPEDAEEEELQALRRAANEDEEAPAALRREAQEEEEAQPLRRAEDDEEEELQTLRRAAPEEEAVQPVRRASGEEDEEALPLRRASPALGLETAPFPEEMRDEPEPELGPMRRAVAAEAAAPGAPITPFDPGAWAAPGPLGSPRPAEASARPSVHIDQIDVLIHEPAAPAGGGRAADRSRAIRARYLRRL